MKVTLDQIAAALAREVRLRGTCRQGVHSNGVCGCGHCVVLAVYDRYIADSAIIQTPESAAAAAEALRSKADQPGERHDEEKP